jgi:chromosome condensin MukBEF ATPase and DNA-binding subunit MukB
MFAFLLPLLGWAKAIPLKDWLYAAAFATAVAGYLYWAHHERAIGRAQEQAQITDLQTRLTEAQSANRSNDDAIKALQAANHLCEAGRIADQAAQTKALQDRDTAQAKLSKDAATARSKLQALLAGRCKAWADQPACGVSQ